MSRDDGEWDKTLHISHRLTLAEPILTSYKISKKTDPNIYIRTTYNVPQQVMQIEMGGANQNLPSKTFLIYISVILYGQLHYRRSLFWVMGCS